MAEVKEKVIDLCNKISMVKRGSKGEITPDDPEYKLLECVVTNEMAEAALCLKFREPRSAEEVASVWGRPVEETERILRKCGDVGAAMFRDDDGVNMYWLELWVPGHMEMVVNNSENYKKYPQIGEAFDGYGKKKAPLTAGNFPIGTGPMRTIPIESAIDGETRRASYEEISGYLNSATVFSVSDCSCRTARETMGEGCGHLKEDMCIQLGDAADYYIQSGKGREITREEAFEIIKKAEENGLMHNIPNIEEVGHTHAICNCCGCGCFAVRNANMWRNPDFIKSNYLATVDMDKCVACGECVENCPTNALTLGQKLCADTLPRKKKPDLPHNTEWGPEYWNVDYRTNRAVVAETGTSPCKAECPAHIGIQGYLKLASQGRYTEALELIKEENPFPAVCGRVCPRKCESTCTRGDVDDPIAIDEVKKFIAQKELDAETRFIPKKRHNYGKKIAIVGAGPAGLSCAYYLAIDGYEVTVFEKEKALGGMLTMGIPSYRLEKDVVNAEIDILRDMGVAFKTGVDVGRDITLDDLRGDGYEAFYLAIGAQSGRKIGIEGEATEGVMTGVDFLRKVNLGEEMELAGKTIVIGGGNVAIDVARTATRVGASSVSMYCLESSGEMPALKEEVDEATEEDIVINNSWGPKRVVTENGRVTGVEFVKCVSVFDENGRFSPTYDDHETTVVDADHVLISVGQAMDWGRLIEGSRIELNPNQTVKADELTLQTGEPDVFAGGDALIGPSFAIDAIAMGKEGAISIHRYVHPGQSLVLGRIKREYVSFDKTSLNLSGYDRVPREKTDHVDGKKAKQTFKDLRGTFTEEQVRKETERCLGCGATVVDDFMCVGCGMCTTKCKFDAIKLVRVRDEAGVDFGDLKKTVVRHVLKRKVKIAVAKPWKKLKKAVSM
ncbi:pyridine nucleotide-disulfide oxidoreductase [Desulfoluna limicola]|uniref:Pyridine nucleotide-disulfide oxidoreductase n=1 Tax=Desulfoluna limicola TaxID=2810562 RepID=A0ABM7PD62_9BACT|nr:FAD-dependent oxidoreductase [Desulfoluna limicola]BCS95145.1 pyridine nucleotide-disulfide oxidoreductase [Desulfoluna limicola]